MSGAIRRAAAASAALAFGAAVYGGVIARADSAPRAAAATGGLSISPAILEHAATPGSLGTMTVANNSKQALDVTLTPRPWTQSRSGAASADRRHTLANDVRASESSFTLAAGGRKAVALSLLRVPAGGALYGNVEVIGVPRDADKRQGVVVGHRLIGTLRLAPAAPIIRLQAANPKLTGKGRDRALVLPVRNRGNTIEPITGTVRLKGPRGTRNSSIGAVRILPGRIVDLRLASLSSLPKGSYTLTVKLTQARQETAVSKRLRI